MAIRYHWQDGDADTDLVAPPPRRPGPRRVALVAGVLLVAALGGAGLFIWQRSEQGQRAALADLQAVVNAEEAALRQGDEEVYLSLQDYGHRQWYRYQQLYWVAAQRAAGESAPAATGRLGISELELRDDRAWVVVEYERERHLYHRVQFYRLDSGGWRRTAPDERFWGEPREVKTEHLLFHTNEREEAIVRPAAEALEVQVQQMIADFALAEPARQLVFEFQPAAEAETATYSEARFPVPSPMLLGVRADGADPDLLASLAQDAGLFLAIEKSGLYVRAAGPGSSWVMLKGLVAWELEQRLSHSVVPGQWNQWMREALATESQPVLQALWPPYEFRTDRDSAIAFVQAQAVVGYAVKLRGLAVLPLLLQSLGAKLTAEETIWAAVQMDLPTFEAGWRAYVGDLVSSQT